jgi:3,4-dihydroxy 2-butanone 4-phosphate synthase/GTP cyclohydrolase II
LKVIERIPIEINHTDDNHFYLETKKARMGHMLNAGRLKEEELAVRSQKLAAKI